MNELLDIAIKAHGGLERWSKVNAVKTAASITGAISSSKVGETCLRSAVTEHRFPKPTLAARSLKTANVVPA
jgi:hypothetical protein